jgi:hypothetical protein
VKRLVPAPDTERGQATVMIIGLAVVLLMAVAVVVDSSAAFLHRQRLDTVADGAALAGADAGSRNLAVLYGDGVAVAERLDQTEVLARAAVADHLRRSGAHAAYPGLTYEVRVGADRSVTVRVAAPLDLPLTLPGAPGSTIVSATGEAVVQLDRPPD